MTDLDVKPFMLERHDQHARNPPCDGTCPVLEVLEEAQNARAHAIAELKDLRETRPVLVLRRDLRVALHTSKRH